MTGVAASRIVCSYAKQDLFHAVLTAFEVLSCRSVQCRQKTCSSFLILPPTRGMDGKNLCLNRSTRQIYDTARGRGLSPKDALAAATGSDEHMST